MPSSSYGDSEHGRRSEDISCARTVPERYHHSVCASPCVGRGTGSCTEEPSWLVGWKVGVRLLTCQCSVLAGMAIVVFACIKLAAMI
jgi:hypothetical protein